jgi:hypothetical protein
MADFEECLEQFPIDHDRSPLAAMRRAGLRVDDFPAAFRCAPVDRHRAVPLADAGGLLWLVDREVLADQDWLTEIHVTDATRLPPGESVAVARLGPKGCRTPPRALARLLMETGILRCYWHLEATVCLRAETAGSNAWEGRYEGEHVYYTSRRNTGAFRFTLRVADGLVTVIA